MFIEQRITIVRVRKPPRPSINDELQWLGSSLGLFSLRDKDRCAFRVFLELLKTSKLGLPLSSDELAERVGLSRGTVVHHLNNLMQSGLVVHDGRRYWLRRADLEILIDELKRDLERNIDDLRQAARDVDEWLG